MQRRQAVLPVDDQVLRTRLFQVADVVEALERIEVQALGREQQDGARDRRLALRRFIEVLDRRHLGPRQIALERAVAAFDLRDELRDVVVFLDLGGRDLPLLSVEAADELDLVQQVVRRVRDEIEDAVLLPHLGREHGWILAQPCPDVNARLLAHGVDAGLGGPALGRDSSNGAGLTGGHAEAAVADVGVPALAAIVTGHAGRAARAVHAHAAATAAVGIRAAGGPRPIVGPAEAADAAIERATVLVDLARATAVAVDAGPTAAFRVEDAAAAADRIGLAEAAQARVARAAFQDGGAGTFAGPVSAAGAEAALAAESTQRGHGRQRRADAGGAAFARLAVGVDLARPGGGAAGAGGTALASAAGRAGRSGGARRAALAAGAGPA